MNNNYNGHTPEIEYGGEVEYQITAVSVAWGKKVNLGNYESVECSVTIHARVPADVDDEVVTHIIAQKAINNVDSCLQKEIEQSEYASQLQADKRQRMKVKYQKYGETVQEKEVPAPERKNPIPIVAKPSAPTGINGDIPF